MVEELMEGVLVRIAGVYEQVGWWKVKQHFSFCKELEFFLLCCLTLKEKRLWKTEFFDPYKVLRSLYK